MLWIVVLHGCIIVASVWFFIKKYNAGLFWRRAVIGVITAKLIVLYGFVWVHENLYSHYKPDFRLIWEDASHLTDICYQNPQTYLQYLKIPPSDVKNWHLSAQPRAFFSAKIFSFFAIITYKNFWITAIYSSLFALGSMWVFARTVSRLYAGSTAVLGVFLLLPSGIFWASATSKESIVMCCIALGFSMFLKLFESSKKWAVKSLILVLSLIVLWKIKYYYAFGMSFSMIIYAIVFLYQKYNFNKWKLAGVLMLAGLGAIALSFLHPNLTLNHLPEALYNNYELILKSSPEGSCVKLDLESTWWSMLIHSPQALYLGVFAPLPWDSQNIPMTIASIENTLLLVLSVYVLLKIVKNKPQTVLPFALVGMLSVYVGIMAIFLALSSPNFGALSRYRCGFSPFLWYVLLSCLPLKNLRLFKQTKVE